MCHQCNSYENALCADPFSHEDGQVKSNDEFLKECGDEQDYTMCRKVYQNGEFPGGQAVCVLV